MTVSFYTEIIPQKDKWHSHILQCFVVFQNGNVKYGTTVSALLLPIETDNRTQCGLHSFEPIFNSVSLCNSTVSHIKLFELYILFQPDLTEVREYSYRKSMVKYDCNSQNIINLQCSLSNYLA